MYLNVIQRGDNPKPFIAAKESHSIRLVMANIQGSNPIESVVDPGSSIIAMSEEVCHNLGLIYNTLVIIDLQSANGGIDHSLGLAWNVLCEIGGIMLYVQIHIIRHPAYDVLLG
jgi:predicted aspartyl protease